MEAEKLQLQTAARLFRGRGLGCGGLTREKPATCGYCATRAAAPLDTVRAVYLALAAPGGHLGRKGDGSPGWQTRWLGRRSLCLLAEGVNMAVQLLDE